MCCGGKKLCIWFPSLPYLYPLWMVVIPSKNKENILSSKINFVEHSVICYFIIWLTNNLPLSHSILSLQVQVYFWPSSVGSHRQPWPYQIILWQQHMTLLISMACLNPILYGLAVRFQGYLNKFWHHISCFWSIS